MSSKRNGILEQIKSQEAQVKTKQTELKTAKGQISFKDTSAVDAEVKRLNAQVESGNLKLVEERKTLDQVSQLHKQRKILAGLEIRQAEIDKMKESISKLRESLNSIDRSAQQTEYTETTKELDSLSQGKKDQFTKLNAARDDLRAARDRQQKAYDDMRSFKSKHFEELDQYRKYEREAFKKRQERQKAERDAYQAEKRKQALEERLEEAKIAAYGEEIRAADALIRLLDPTGASTDTDNKSAESSFAAQPQRKVQEADFKGTRLQRKTEDEDSYFIGGGGKSKKGRKNNKADATEKQQRFGQITMSQREFELIGVKPPASVDENQEKLEEVKAKKAFFLSDRDRKTKDNVEKARKEFEEANAAEDAAKANGNDTDEKLTTNGESFNEVASANGKA